MLSREANKRKKLEPRRGNYIIVEDDDKGFGVASSAAEEFSPSGGEDKANNVAVCPQQHEAAQVVHHRQNICNDT